MVRPTNSLSVLGLLFLTSGLAHAQLDFDDDGYGFDANSFVAQNICLDANGVKTTGPCVMTGEEFLRSPGGGTRIFDFLIDSKLSNFTLTLTGTGGTMIAAGAFSQFTTDGGTTYNECLMNNPGGRGIDQCGPDPASQMTGDPTKPPFINNTVSFDVTGTNAGSPSGFVFFAALDDPNTVTSDSTTLLDLTGGGTATELCSDPRKPCVTASITLNPPSVSTPEATTSLPMLGFGLISVIVFRREKLARLP